VEAEPAVADPGPPQAPPHALPKAKPRAKAKLRVWQKLTIAILFVIQVPVAILFYTPAAIIALTGIGLPVSFILMGIGSSPATLAMNRKRAWQAIKPAPVATGAGIPSADQAAMATRP
jgi:hypothetical protein